MEVEVVELDVVELDVGGAEVGAVVDGARGGAVAGAVELGPGAVVVVWAGGSGTVGPLVGERPVPPPPKTSPIEVPPE